MQWLNEITIQLIDVRELSEYETFNIGGKHIALSTLHQRMDEIDSAIITVVHCQSGARSKQAINIIRGRYSNIKLYNLKRGLLDFQELNVKTGTETYYKIYSSGAGKFKLLV
jgi:adenylyltransferase/sulfurtransferase